MTAIFQELFPGGPVTIGSLLPMYHAMLLSISEDATQISSPVLLREGAKGELAISGPCLAKGYVQLEAITAEKFIVHPMVEGERLYRTGDLVRLDKDLNLVFLGRIDTQVKHRGFCIELGEIEHAITTHPRIQTAAIILSKATERLEAYIVVKYGNVIEMKELRENLQKLPSYMQPENIFFISADEMPRIHSGGINLKALQDMSAQLAASEEAQRRKSHVVVGENVLDDDWI